MDDGPPAQPPGDDVRRWFRPDPRPTQRLVPPLDGIADPTALYRLREGVYAPDLLIAAVAEFDLFSCIAAHGVLRASAPAGDEASAQP